MPWPSGRIKRPSTSLKVVSWDAHGVDRIWRREHARLHHQRLGFREATAACPVPQTDPRPTYKTHLSLSLKLRTFLCTAFGNTTHTPSNLSKQVNDLQYGEDNDVCPIASSHRHSPQLANLSRALCCRGRYISASSQFDTTLLTQLPGRQVNEFLETIKATITALQALVNQASTTAAAMLRLAIGFLQIIVDSGLT